MPGEHWKAHNDRLRGQILFIVDQYWEEHDHGPSRNYLATQLGVSRSTAHTQVSALIAAGELTQDEGKPNTLRRPE